MDALAAREAANAQLDERAGATAQQAEELLRERLLRVDSDKPMPVGGVVLADESSIDMGALLAEEPEEPEEPEEEPESSSSARPLSARGVPPSGGTAGELGDVADATKLRLQTARLQMLEEEMGKLRSALAERTEALAVAEKLAKDEQAQRAKLER